MNTENKIFCIISHTHWDREWYMPLENFRQRLVDLMDRLLEILDKEPRYIFHLDAQTIVLEDYLAVRPDRRDVLRRHIQNRRIIIGPWYLANDFYLVSGEATIRNLLEGGKLCREFGECAKAGYAADQFGNISQLPQILKGFGINNFIFGRGVKAYELDENGTAHGKKTETEFIWQGPDGSRALAIHMRHWYNNAQRFSADIDKSLRYLKSIESHYNDEFTLTPYILLMNGVDHLEAQPDIVDIAEELQKRLAPGKYIMQYTMEDYVADVERYINENDITPKTVEGELRHSGCVPELQGTLSSRNYLKVANDRAQILLENRLEPLYSMLELQGMRGIYPHDRLVYSWKNLMRNQPHDSICGCSHDGVHRHMENRFEEFFEFGCDQLSRALLDAASHTSALREGRLQDYNITVANTLSIALRGTVSVELMMLASDDIEQFCILDDKGLEVPFVVLNKRPDRHNIFSPVNLPVAVDVYKYTLLLDAGEVAAYSLKGFTVTKKAGAVIKCQEPLDSLAEISNGILSLRADKNGGVSLTDLRSGRVIPHLITIEDMADKGQSYKTIPFGEPICEDSFEASVSVTEKNPLRSAVKIDYLMNLPEHFDKAVNARSKSCAQSRLSITLSLSRGEDFVRVSYCLDNASRDHRLRIGFNSGVTSDFAEADTPFDIVRRNPRDAYPGTPAKIFPNTSFACISDGDDGLAVFTIGHHAFELQNGTRLLFDIVRATGTINDGATENWITPENQCLRRLEGEFGVCPFKKDVISADIPNRSLAFRAPLIAVATPIDTKKFAIGRPCVQDTTLAEQFFLPDKYPTVAIENNQSAIEVSGKGVTVTALKCSEDESGTVLRLCNLSDSQTHAQIKALGKIFKTELCEKSRSFIGRDDITIPLGAKEILTLYIN